MPRKNSLKTYSPDLIYHVYNRGVAKQAIFRTDQDYIAFLGMLKRLLDPSQPNNFAKDIDVVSFCLMRNHFHLLLKNKTQNGIEIFMRSAMTRYSMYFNRHHKRVGSLFQGVYKAKPIDKDDYYMHISRYIHLNPHGIKKKSYKYYKYSSYQYYIGKLNAHWIKPDLLGMNEVEYQVFCDEYLSKKTELDEIKHLLANAYEI